MSEANSFLYTEDEKLQSGDSTSIFTWSPLPQRRRLSCCQNKNKIHKDSEENTKLLYPNCDVTVWLRSCEEEIKTPINGNITGIIPNWINGSLIRNGPGSLKVADEEFDHLFDSSALLHRFHINNGNVTYQCRFVQSEVYKKNWAAKRIVMSDFGTKTVEDPCHSIFKRIATIFSMESADNSMISVYPFGDELYAFGETPVIHRINSNTLETEERLKITDHVSIVHHTSHPHVLNDGTVYNLGTSVYVTGPHYNIIKFPKNETGSSKEMFENAHIVASVPARWPFHPSYMHTFGITDNYYIIVEQPMSISVSGMIRSKFKNEPLSSCFRWYHEEYTQLSIVSRTTGKVIRTYFSEAFFYLHIINQFEYEDHVIIDICIYKDPSMLDSMYIETMKTMQQNPDYGKMFRGRPARFVLPLNPDTTADYSINLVKLKNTNAKAYYTCDGKVLVKPEKICDLGCETPRINYDNHLGKPYKYFYAISSEVDSENPGAIIKVNAELKTTKTWSEKGFYPSEPIFVPNPQPKDEDDGIVLTALVRDYVQTNYVGLLVLNAKTFTEIGRAEFQTPSQVPKCLHGWFLPTHNQKLRK